MLLKKTHHDSHRPSSSNLLEGPMFCMSVGEQLPRTDISQ